MRPPELQSVRDAARLLEGVAVRTSLKPAASLSARCGVPVFLKLENEQPVGAFKVRGAYTAIARLDPAERARGVITYSSGNHGQAVAFAAKRLGIRAVIVMPESAPRIKVDGVRRLEGEVEFAGTRSVDRLKRAEELVAEQGLCMIPPYENPDVIAGQGTCGLEILEQCPEVDTILVPVGGGGLIAGISLVAHALRPSARVTAVEPEGAPKLHRALAAGEPVQLEKTETIADGLMPLAVGALPFEVIDGKVGSSVLVTDEGIAEAMRVLFHDEGVRAEPSGAAATAALLQGTLPLQGPVVAVVSGGNVDQERFERLVGG
ncbi:MAG: threonine ammonia-lyase [Gemmatimonadales bacterium]